MNDNDGLLRPTRQTEYDWGVTPRPVLFGTDIPDPRTIIEPYEVEPVETRTNRAGPIIAWVAIIVVIGLAMVSIVWGI